MAKKKKTIRQRCTSRVKNKSKDVNAEPFHQRRGIEACIEKIPESFEVWGRDYQSLLRKSVKLLQSGQTKEKLSPILQKKYDLQWAWVDSLLTDAKGTVDQLNTAKDNQISELKEDIESGQEKASKMIEEIQEALEKPTKKNLKGISKKLLGIKSKLNKNNRQKKKLANLESRENPKICFGSKKLFNAQYYLKDNGYKNHEEWLVDWRKSRSGNFYSVGKGSAYGNNLTTKILHKEGNLFICEMWVPRYLQQIYGEFVAVEFTVTGQRKHDLLFAIEASKPITVQVFRREHKDDKWYIHLTTYVQEVPWAHTKRNGSIGVDINAKSIDVIYIKPDGNPGTNSSGKFIKFSFELKDEWTTGQRKAKLRDIAARIVTLAECLNCGISLEILDFSVKKSRLRNSGSKKYNRMLSGLVYDGIRSAILCRAEKQGVQVDFVYPMNTSLIGCIKYQQKYGLNSAFSAAMVVARISLGHKERIPSFFRNLLYLPVDRVKAGSGEWKTIYKLFQKHYISRHSQFQMSTVEEVLKSSLKPKRRTSNKRKSRTSKGGKTTSEPDLSGLTRS